MFRKTENGWERCSEDEAEIGMNYCDDCKCDQMVHESIFMNEEYEDGRRPYEHLFWKKDGDGWTGFRDKENKQLYNKIYGKEFKLNEFITVKLEYETTVIYVNGELFRQCKFLMMNIPIAKLEDYDEIDSIDEAADILGWSVNGQHDENGELLSYQISPENEFWGHCSNLQVWTENAYDTRILHSNLSFPLLRKLTEVGDPIATAVFQEEICKRFESSAPTTLKYLLEEKYLQYLTDDQREDLLHAWMRNDIENVMVFLIGNNYLEQFGERYRPVIMKELTNHIETRENIHLERELDILFKELDIPNTEDFIIQLLSSDRTLLKDIFDLRQYPVPEEAVEGINYTHLGVLKKLKKFLTQLSQNDRKLDELISHQVRELFEIPSVGNMFSLLFYSFYELLSLTKVEEMILRRDSPFLSNLFNYLGHEVMMMYYDSSMAPYDFLFTYLDDNCRRIFANEVGNLPSDLELRVVNGISVNMKHKTYYDRVVKLLNLIRSPRGRPGSVTNLIP